MRRLRLAGEEGIALVLAVLIMAVLTVTVMSVISFTSANARDATSKKAGQQAYALAEAGLSNAFAQLASHYYKTDGTTPLPNTTAAYDPSWSIGQATCSPTPCSTWGVTSWSPAASGSTKGTLKLWGAGRVVNPSGAGTSAIARTVTENVDVTQAPALITPPPVWNMVYAGKKSSGCDFTLGQGTSVAAPLYVAGNLCAGQKGSVVSPATLVVGGWVDLGQKGALGTSGSPLASAQIVGSCDGSESMATSCQINKSGGKVWANPSGVHTSPTITSPITLPPSFDFSGVASTPTPSSCLAATFHLTQSSYSCTWPTGTLAFNSSTNKLTINGNVYINGTLVVDMSNVTYTGIGSIFVNGPIQFANNAYICVTKSGGDCDFANAWDTSQNLLLLIAKSDITAKNVHFQGGMYSDTLISVGSGQTETQGPLVSPQIIDPGQQAAASFPELTVMYSGAPGTTNPPFQLGKPYGGSY